jgi:hypothetical protein
VVNDFAKDTGLAHATGNQLRILRTKVND